MGVRKDTFLGARVEKSVQSAFVKKLKKLGVDPSQAIREMVIAYLEDRLTVTPQTKEFLK